MTEAKSTDQMYLEDVTDAVERILNAPLPIVGNRAAILTTRITLALDVLHGRTHPGDVQMAPIGSIDEQIAAAIGK